MDTLERIVIKDLSVDYGNFQALKKINLAIKEEKITALIGPSGCGKSTLLRTLNRMNDLIKGVRITGTVYLDGENIYNHNTNLVELRKKVGMLFQRPNPFPLTIFDNLAYGLKVRGINNKKWVKEKIEKSLKDVGLWEELKDKLKRPALSLSLEQQQRLCLARLLVVEPEVILMDEPCSALDPIATSKIEELMFELKKEYTVIIVTHNMQQAARVSDFSGFLLFGDLVEFNETGKIFTAPEDKRTQDYITGRFG